MAHIKSGVGSFRKGKFYRRKENPSIVKYIHSKPIDYFGRQNLLVTVRWPTSEGAYVPVMAVTSSLIPEEWCEINQEVFEAAMAGRFDPTTQLVQTNENQEIINEFWEEKETLEKEDTND